MFDNFAENIIRMLLECSTKAGLKPYRTLFYFQSDLTSALT